MSTHNATATAAQATKLGIEVQHASNRYEVSLRGSRHFDGALTFLKSFGFKYDKSRKVWWTKNSDIAAKLSPTTVGKPKLVHRPIDVFAFDRLITPTYWVLNKVLADFPLARGARCKADWVVADDGGATATLPGEDKVRLHLRPGNQRCPTAFDVNLLGTLLALGQVHSSPCLVFKTYRVLLSLLGYSKEGSNVVTLKDALDYLQRLSVTITHGGKATTLPPPIKQIVNPTRTSGLEVEVDEDFYYFAINRDKPPAKLPLPLPTDFTVQNLMLLLEASSWKTQFDEEDGEVSPYKYRPLIAMHELARKVGLNHAMRNRDLRAAFEKVKAIYQQHGVKMEFYQSVNHQSAEVGFMRMGDMKFKPVGRAAAEAAYQRWAYRQDHPRERL
jgi:hypothetical protein